MRLVTRSDGFALNLDAGVSFKEHKNDLIVEFPGNEFYIVEQFGMSDLDLDHKFLREFKGWPE